MTELEFRILVCVLMLAPCVLIAWIGGKVHD